MPGKAATSAARRIGIRRIGIRLQLDHDTGIDRPILLDHTAENACVTENWSLTLILSQPAFAARSGGDPRALGRGPALQRLPGAVERRVHGAVVVGELGAELDHIAVRVAKIDRIDEAVV